MDPWAKVKTLNDFKADHVISALQKEIRRGEEENAILLALEMVKTSPELERYLWHRLMVISVEDIGFGDKYAPLIIQSLKHSVNEMDSAHLERELFAVHAVRYLCLSKKDRTSDERINLINRFFTNEEKLPFIPDYAIDMHTDEGIEKGKDFRDFINEGSHINNISESYDSQYKEKIIEILKNNSK